MKFIIPLAALLIHSFLITTVQAADAEAFRSKYLRAYKELEATYSTIICEGVYSFWENPDKLCFSEDEAIYQNAGKIVLVATRGKTPDEAWAKRMPPGTEFRMGGSPDLFFSATKRPGKSEYSYAAFAPVKSLNFQKTMWMRCPVSSSPYAVLDTSLEELFSSKDFALDKLSVKESALEGTISMTFKIIDATSRTKSIDVVLNAKSLAVMEYTIDGPGYILRGQVLYENPGPAPPEVKAVDRWRERAGLPKKLDRTLFVVKSLQFVKTPEAKFTPEGLGMGNVTVLPKNEEPKGGH